MNLDELDSKLNLANLAATPTASTAELVSKDSYRLITSASNVTSYSKLQTLHVCPRKYKLEQLDAATNLSPRSSNLDFAYGHAVGAGVQEYFKSRDLDSAILQAFIAWDVDIFEANYDARKKKSFVHAVLAITKAVEFIELSELGDYELATINNKPAVEFSFILDCGNGYFHRGHIDLILQEKNTKKLAILELKTSAFKGLNAAIYYNSDQAISYSLVLDYLFSQHSSFDVYYMVYSTPDESWGLLPVAKTLAQKLEFIQSLLLDHTAISQYSQINFFPKRGSSCYNFSRECRFFMQCNSYLDREPNILTLAEILAASQIDAVIDLNSMLNAV